MAAALAIAVLGRDARSEVPLYQQEPYDQITLDENNQNAVLKVFPLDLPGRRVPDPLPRSGKFAVRLVDKPDTDYELEWHAVAKIELFYDLVLAKANELVAAGQLEAAYDYFDFLLQKDPKLPGLDAAIDNYLYEEAKASLGQGRHDESLAMLRALYDRNPKWQGLENALGMVTDKLVERHVGADNYWTARQLLRNLAALYPNHAVVARWEGQLRAEAASLLAEGQKADQAGRLREAHAFGRRVMQVWPALPEGRQFINAMQRKYPRVVVGVTLPAGGRQGAALYDWAARRSSRLVERTLVEFVGRGSEGGKYECPYGQVEIQELGLRLAFQIDPQRARSLGLPGLTGYTLARELLALANPRHPEYRPDWAELVEEISVREVYGVDAALTRPHVRPEAVLQTVALSGSGGAGGASDSSGQSASTGPYLVEPRFDENAKDRNAKDGNDEVVYLANPGYSLGAAQPKEIVERYCRRGEEAILALKRREIDVLDRVNPWDLDKAASVDGVVVERYGVPVVHCLVPNLSRPLVARRGFRRALVYGIHREGILEHLLRGQRQPVPGCQVLSGPFSPGMSPNDPLGYACDDAIEPRPYEPRLAVALAQVALSEEAAAKAKQGVKVTEIPELVLAYPAHEIARVACTSIQRQLKLVGIPVALRELAHGVPARVPDDVDLLYVEISMYEPVVDARRVLGADGLVGQSSNFMSQALRQLDQARDWAQTASLLRSIHRLAYTELPVIPLWQLTDHYAYHRSLRGVGTDLVSLYQNVEQWEPATEYAVAE